jgi:hypothetical protein
VEDEYIERVQYVNLVEAEGNGERKIENGGTNKKEWSEM